MKKNNGVQERKVRRTKNAEMQEWLGLILRKYKNPWREFELLVEFLLRFPEAQRRVEFLELGLGLWNGFFVGDIEENEEPQRLSNQIVDITIPHLLSLEKEGLIRLYPFKHSSIAAEIAARIDQDLRFLIETEDVDVAIVFLGHVFHNA